MNTSIITVAEWDSYEVVYNAESDEYELMKNQEPENESLVCGDYREVIKYIIDRFLLNIAEELITAIFRFEQELLDQEEKAVGPSEPKSGPFVLF
jgi:hypothetical protein